MSIKYPKIESEIKVKISSPDDFFLKILDIGASSQGEEFQMNIFFDRKDNLRANDEFLRLRGSRTLTIYLQDDEWDDAYITFKGRRDKDSISINNRVENEIEVFDFDASYSLMRQLGFEEFFRFEKRRRKFELRHEGIEIMLDEIPLLGHYLEIEGEESKVLEITEALGMSGMMNIQKSYLDLLLEHTAGLSKVLF